MYLRWPIVFFPMPRSGNVLETSFLMPLVTPGPLTFRMQAIVGNRVTDVEPFVIP